jgi:hypothetical protein
MANNILADNWSDYDNLKLQGNPDTHFFSCEEQWERDYLRDKIHRIYPEFGIQQIESAIALCCKSTPPPRPRNPFVECVMTILRN